MVIFKYRTIYITCVDSLSFLASLYHFIDYQPQLKMTMSDFTLFLPCEIFTEILSHVNQEDCMECMAVCRRWHKLIPQHAKDVWKELEISEKSWSRFNNAISQCLIYVEKVSFLTPQNAHKKLQRLERQGCNIQSLGKLILCMIITYVLRKTEIN